VRRRRSIVHLAYSYPPQAARGPQDGERGGQRGKEQEKEEGEQTPTPGVAPGLRRRSGRKAAGELECSSASRRAVEESAPSAMTAANTAAMPLDNA
jgi:hypothetical protein